MSREERIAQNEALFRQVNERVLDVSIVTGLAEDGPEFVCECGDEACIDRVRLSVREYEAVRANPRRFFVRPGHERPDVERVVADRGGYRIVEKEGAAGELADRTDPRS